MASRHANATVNTSGYKEIEALEKCSTAEFTPIAYTEIGNNIRPYTVSRLTIDTTEAFLY